MGYLYYRATALSEDILISSALGFGVRGWVIVQKMFLSFCLKRKQQKFEFLNQHITMTGRIEVRHIISTLLNAGKTPTAIVRDLGCARSLVYKVNKK